jgi:phosphoribosylglycinamide formyltransferase-1
MQNSRQNSSSQRQTIAVLLSGRGSNFKAILNAIHSGDLCADVSLVLSNKPEAPGLEFARENNIHVEARLVSEFPSKDNYEQWLIRKLQNVAPDVIVLAGYMRVLGPQFIDAFPDTIINIHPSLLPAFKGLNAQKQALDYGVKFAGCTVHYVDHTVDGGQIIDQRVVEVTESDTEDSLSQRILAQEHELYPLCIQRVLDQKRSG